MAKTDPKCSDVSTLREGGFVMRNINIHHNRIRNTLGEGIYIGYTGSQLVTSNLSCDGNPVFAHWIEDVTIAHNRIHRTGLDAVQLNLVEKNGIIRDNRIGRYATRNEVFRIMP